MPVISFLKAINPVQENRDPPWRKKVMTARLSILKRGSFIVSIFNCFGAGIWSKETKIFQFANEFVLSNEIKNRMNFVPKQRKKKEIK